MLGADETPTRKVGTNALQYIHTRLPAATGRMFQGRVRRTEQGLSSRNHIEERKGGGWGSAGLM